ncbi:SDR family oxidoreductase [Corynebacterium anserum]|uniref:SDR family oxidoreductase n=1 Tax=Corynebacterium anserum TaxID=2684406 RepID=A0A7G7YNU0_9CORY|nr:SDR family oxidoreductase [Corynebacterium anserum]MBC2681754.1 SDR family oxidoreductase [Corynebacterium anserum]QNH96160.1 SDR family oxidoreductase [Corynebacterium anserum]
MISSTAVVTGAASGIGRSLAIALATMGYHLHLTDRDPDGLSSTRTAIEAAGTGQILSLRTVDITDQHAVVSWADALVAEYGVPDEVYHVAGIAIWGDARTMPHDKWTRVIDVNLMGSVHIVEGFAQHLTVDNPTRKTKRRKLVFVSSAAGIIGLPWHAAYSASKGGVLGMCEVLRFDLAPRGVDVHVVAPGAVDTPLVSTIDIDGVDQTNKRVLTAKKLFQGHAQSPEQVAASIIRGVRKNKYLIFTSRDIALARWAQVNAPFAYRGAMKLLNRGFRWVAAGAQLN